MLRQANDQLERTMNEKQELEDSMKQGHEETNTKVGNIFNIIVRLNLSCQTDDRGLVAMGRKRSTLSSFSSDLKIIHTWVELEQSPCWFSQMDDACLGRVPKVSALMQKVQESESTLSVLQQAFSQAKRNTQEEMVQLIHIQKHTYIDIQPK